MSWWLRWLSDCQIIAKPDLDRVGENRCAGAHAHLVDS